MRGSIKLFLFICLITGCRERRPASNQAVAFENINIKPVPGNWPASFGWGRTATETDIRKLDIDVRPDGKGLPEGSGTVAIGRKVYALKCENCHGSNNVNGIYQRLFPHTIPDSSKGQKLIGNYWPYATTLYDYINRAMPFNQPGSLTKEEVYSVTAYLLYMNKLWPEHKVIQKNNLAQVVMPAHDRFVPDDRKGGPEIK